MMSAPAVNAQTVSLNGVVANICVLTLTTPGILTVSSGGTEIATSNAGAIPALMSVVATGTNPTVTFTAPALTGPSASGATTEISFSSPGGANRAFASTGYTRPMTGLLDTLTINGRARNSSGFQTGTYSITSTATCSQ
ncbi:hypothetical protein [Sphingobium subterraneum]|uniref:DUF4402 domain-containing protein n=1 Tax=Sphingobium subterraneum TaxID=627688 RepID=A0A841J998_9SPHN|nr:hypothetical protein [Sphingobium subterraneum]MBB6124731.1 hypothetical protein [Sphingobium subterraneum]